MGTSACPHGSGSNITSSGGSSGGNQYGSMTYNGGSSGSATIGGKKSENVPGVAGCGSHSATGSYQNGNYRLGKEVNE